MLSCLYPLVPIGWVGLSAAQEVERISEIPPTLLSLNPGPSSLHSLSLY